jgi:hypothetical protein
MATSKKTRDALSSKIAKLRSEGKKGPQAIAAAYSMKRKGKLGPGGGYKKERG